MTAVRKIVDSSALADIFDLPPAFKNKKLEVFLFPAEDTASSKYVHPLLTMAQIEKWANAPEIQSLVGALKETDLPENITMSDIRNERLAEKYIT